MAIDSEKCLLCGTRLRPLLEPVREQCQVCGKSFRALNECESGHWVCPDCAQLERDDFIEQFCLNSDSTDPLEVAVQLMWSPLIPSHGQAHLYLVSAVLISCYSNRQQDSKLKKMALAQAKRIVSGLPDTAFEKLGVSSAPFGASLFLRLIRGVEPDQPLHWRDSNQLAAMSLNSISKFVEERCSKRDSFLTIIEALNILRENYDMIFTHLGVQCEFRSVIDECMGPECPFWGTVHGTDSIV